LVLALVLAVAVSSAPQASEFWRPPARKQKVELSEEQEEGAMSQGAIASYAAK
jgi:hypothetical protein